MLIPFATNSYRSLSLPISAQRALNMFAEREPPDTKTPVAVLGAPGIAPFATCGTGPIRGMRGMADVLYVVSGSTLFSVTSAAVVTQIGEVGSATGTIGISDNGTQVFILNNGVGWLYRQKIEATLSSPAAANASHIIVDYTAAVAAMQVNDALQVSLTNGENFTTNVASITLAVVQTDKPIGVSASFGNLVTDAESTSTAVTSVVHPALATDVTIYVASIDGFTAGDAVTIALDDGTTFSGKIAALTPGVDIGLTGGLPSGADAGAIVTDSTSRLSQVTDPAFFTAATVSYFDDYFAFDRQGTNEFFLSALADGGTFPPFYRASALVNSDPVISTLADHEMLLVFGSRSIETWYDAGGQDFPFQRYDGATIERGCAAALTPLKDDNAVFFLGDDLVFYRLQGNMLQRISTYAIEQAWAGYSTVSDAYTFSFTIGGHKIIVVQFPTANVTWAYDISSGYWHERDSLDANLASIGKWRGSCAATYFGKVLIGDSQSGAIGTLDWSTYTEFGQVIRGQVVGPAFREDRKRLFMPRFELEIEAGVGLSTAASPILYLAAPLTGGAAAGSTVIDRSADPEVPNFTTTLAAAAAAGAQSISVASAADIGIGDTVDLFLDGGAIQTTTVNFIADPANPKIYLDKSDDGGHTFSVPQLPRGMGAAGAYLTRLRWLRLGQSRQRYLRLTFIDPVKRVIVAAYADTFPGI